MPFNGSGSFSVVNTFVPNTTILSSAVNANFTDIASGLSDCLTRDGQAGMTAVLKSISGSATAPGLTFTTDPTTGIYLVSTGNLGITANSALAATFTTAQVAQFAQAAEAKLFCLIDTADASTSANISTLATSGTGAITIGTSTNWPTNGYLIANNEVMQFTLASATSLTINARAQFGTTAITHANATPISFLYSGMGYNTFLLPFRATAARPASPSPGDMAYNTGSSQPEFYNSTTWVGMAQPNIVPQVRLSPSSTSAIITGDITATNIYIFPQGGNLIPVPTAGIYALQTLTTVATAALSASQAANNIYDVYAFVSGGALTFGFSPSWSAGTSGSVVAGSCARGTSTGGTVLTTAGGFYVNGVAMTLLNGATSYSIATASGIYLGSVFIDNTAGQVTCNPSTPGQNRKYGVWNAFNRSRISIVANEATASWVYNSATIRASNAQPASYVAAAFNTGSGTVCNGGVVFTGLQEEIVDTKFIQTVKLVDASTGSTEFSAFCGIGVNSTTAFSGKQGQIGITLDATVGQRPKSDLSAAYVTTPLFGINNFAMCEQSNTTTTATYFGGNFMTMQSVWKG